MSAEKIFCGDCGHPTNYIVMDTPMTGTIKGEKISYTGKEARCADCGSLIQLAEVADYNAKALRSLYRGRNQVIPIEQILEIPKKYAIGKRPLSLLLGWGEQTFSRYCDGDVPTKQYSDILTRIYNEPLFYSDLLEANKGNLKSNLSYTKSRKATDALLAGQVGPDSKINSVAQYILLQCEDMTPLALQKALYYIQGFFYTFNEYFIFKEDCQAWPHGPVYEEVYNRYLNYRFDPMQNENTFNVPSFTASEKAIFNSVIANLCCYSGKMLTRFTQNETPWITTRGDLPVTEPSDLVIKKTMIGGYFDTVKAKYNMKTPDDIKAYAQDMYSQMP